MNKKAHRLGARYGTSFTDLLETAPISLGQQEIACCNSVSRQPEICVIDRRNKLDRFSFLRQHLSKDSKILEIGPSHNPIVQKGDGYNVYSVDKFEGGSLKERFDKRIGIDVSKIENVDIIWSSDDLSDDIPEIHHHTFDVVIASHVIEHIPNPIGFLRSMEKLLKAGGYISIALPDKRFMFDMFRPLTTTGAWIESFKRGDTIHSSRTLFEFYSMVAANKLSHGWLERRVETERITFSGRDLASSYSVFADDVGSESQYVDCHSWVFTPSSFLLVINEAHALGLIPFVPDVVTSCKGAEFFAHLKLASRRPINVHERVQLHALVAREQAIGFSWIKPAREHSTRRWADALLRRFGLISWNK